MASFVGPPTSIKNLESEKKLQKSSFLSQMIHKMLMNAVDIFEN